jgi:biopolymer transport protein ExbB
MKMKRLFPNCHPTAALAVPLCLALAPIGLGAQEAVAAPPGAATEVTLWTMFQQGGWAMYPLALFSVAVVGLAAYCALLIREKRFTQPEALPALREALEKDDLAAAETACAEYPGYLTDIFRSGLATVLEGHRSAAIMNEAMEERATKVLAAPLVFVQYLQVLASISPMMGLLGTVSGMVKAFRNIAAQGLGKPELLANNISEALITTATGLLIAIPALMAYFYFKNKYARVSTGIYEQLGGLTRLMARRKLLGGEAAPSAEEEASEP